MLSLGRFGKALGPKELVGEMAEEAEELARIYVPRLEGARSRERTLKSEKRQTS